MQYINVSSCIKNLLFEPPPPQKKLCLAIVAALFGHTL